MKATFLKYLPEVIVIFIGITLSFIVEEIREKRTKHNQAIEMMESLVIELERSDEFLQSFDTTYWETEMLLQTYLRGDSMRLEEFNELIYNLTEAISTARLSNISSFIYGFSSKDEVNILSKNKEVLRYMSYIVSLLEDHKDLTQEVTNHSKAFWPYLEASGWTNVLINSEIYSLQDTTDMFLEMNPDLSIVQNKDLQSLMKWSYLKILQLQHVNAALHRQTVNLIHELEKVITE